MGESSIGGGGEWLPKRLNDATGERRRSPDSNLLSKDGPRGELETIPAAGHTDSRIGLDPRRQDRVAPQTAHDSRPVRVQVEHRADALDDEKEGAWIIKLNAHRECIAFL